MIVALRADTAEASLVVFDRQDNSTWQQVHRVDWTAGRQLSNQLLPQIKKALQSVKTDWSDVTGVIVFEGPGSFTGLRISITIANTLAYSLSIPVVGSGGEDWLGQGLKMLEKAKSGQIALPHYGAEPNITQPKS